MSAPLPFVTVIIPTRPGQAEVPAVTAARALDYPKDRLEILVARGRQPAVQRNAALRQARGDWIYFLDDDAIAPPGNLRHALPHFHDPKVKLIGGPNLCPASAPALEQVFAVVLSSWLAFGPSRARYDALGAPRASSEKELILCNMLAHRETLLALGGFNEALYPNEENALMDALQQSGATLLYDPGFAVERRPRPTLRAFCRMLFTYGRGRAEQFRLHPTPGSALNFVPPLFVLYLALALPVGLAGEPRVLLPLAAYGVVVLLQTLASAARKGVVRSVLATPLLAASHLFYGLGFWRGLVTRLRTPHSAPPTEVTIDRITP